MPTPVNQTSVVKALCNALRGRHKYGATNGNQYAARRCSMITRRTRNSIGTGSSLQWSSNFCSLHIYFISNNFSLNCDLSYCRIYMNFKIVVWGSWQIPDCYFNISNNYAKITIIIFFFRYFALPFRLYFSLLPLSYTFVTIFHWTVFHWTAIHNIFYF